MDPQFGDGAIDEGGEAEDERGNAGQREHAMAAELCLKHHQYNGREQQNYRRMPDGQKVQAEEAEQNEERAKGAGYDGAGDVELQVDEKAAEDKQQNGDVRIGEFAEKALADGRGDGDDLRSLQVQGLGRTVEAMDLATVERGEQGGVIG